MVVPFNTYVCVMIVVIQEGSAVVDIIQRGFQVLVCIIGGCLVKYMEKLYHVREIFLHHVRCGM